MAFGMPLEARPPRADARSEHPTRGATVSELQTPVPDEGDPRRGPDRGHDDTPDTPPTEPPPEPVQDPPAEPGPAGPYVVSGMPFRGVA